MTPEEQAFRDTIAAWRASQTAEGNSSAAPNSSTPPGPAYAAALERATDPAQSHFATVSLPRLLLGPRATPARVLRLRAFVDAPELVPLWLGCLCLCAWLRGGIIGGTVVSS